MEYLVAITRPQRLNVPHFAFWHHQTSKDWATLGQLDTKALTDLGPKPAAWLAANVLPDRVKVLRTRNFKAPKNAIYVDWLYFEDAGDSIRFTVENPQFDPDEAAARLRSRQAILERAMQRRLAGADFDLARKYVALAERLKILATEIADIEVVRSLAVRWERDGEIKRHAVGTA